MPGTRAIFRTLLKDADAIAHAGRGATADENVRSNDFSRSARAAATKVATTNLHIFRTGATARDRPYSII
jgi:hypothetical protein